MSQKIPRKAGRLECKALLSGILSIQSSIFSILRIPVTCLPSERTWTKSYPQLGTITSKFLCFSEAPPIFEVVLIAKPAGAKSSNTSCGHSPSGYLFQVAAPFVATAGWLVSLLTYSCEFWAVWNGFGHTNQ